MRRDPSDASNQKARDYVYKHSRSTGNDLLVLMALADYANADRQCYPRVDTIASHAGVSESTVKRATSALQELGELTIEARMDAGGYPTSNLYTILLVPEEYKAEPKTAAKPQDPSAPIPMSRLLKESAVSTFDWMDLSAAKDLAKDDPAVADALVVYQAFGDESGYRRAYATIRAALDGLVAENLKFKAETAERFNQGTGAGSN